MPFDFFSLIEKKCSVNAAVGEMERSGTSRAAEEGLRKLICLVMCQKASFPF